jgi:hypothetical protein
MTSMWKYFEGEYAYQTDEKSIAINMKRRGYDLLNYGSNHDHWVFVANKNCQREAISTLKALTNKSPNYNEYTEVWEC